MLRKISLMLILGALTLLTQPAVSQESGGLIIEANPRTASGIGSLNPLLCNNPECGRLVGLLFPTLLAYDPASGLLASASAQNNGLVMEPQIGGNAVQSFKLRGDMRWSDGQPVTAYDVFFSYLAITSETLGSPYRGRLTRRISGARVVDEHAITFAYEAADCATPTRTNFPIAPAQVFDPDFKLFVDRLNTRDIQPYQDWLKAYPAQKFSALLEHPFNLEPSVTAGAFRFKAVRPGQDIRLATENGEQAFAYLDLPSGLNPTEAFLTGQTNLLINPPYQQRDDLKFRADLQITEYPGQTWDYIAFNLADPLRPHNAFNARGQARDQGRHPLFGDVRVRRAIQLGINVPELIEVAFLGYGTPLAANLLPSSWAFNPDLKPIAYNPREAEDLLEAAGWKDVNRDGIRECVGCQYTTTGHMLAFDLMVMEGNERSVAAELIRRQLARIGVSVNPRPMDAGSVLGEARQQRFDAYLGGWTEPAFYDPDQSGLFTAAGDVIGAGNNTGSYNNPQIEALMKQARSLPGCAPDARANIYRELQTILQADQPYVWLYAPDNMIIAQGGVLGFKPYPNQPLWNMRDWLVIP
jgi:peptide/nickel transport system substrate-binding protein